MSVEIIENEYYKVLICNTTMVAFGDVFNADDDVVDFLKQLPKDARLYTDKELSDEIYKWRNLEE